MSNLALKSDFPTDLRMDLHGIPMLDSGKLVALMSIAVQMVTIFVPQVWFFQIQKVGKFKLLTERLCDIRSFASREVLFVNNVISFHLFYRKSP